MALFDPIRMGASGGADDYEIDRSLRFNRNHPSYLSRTPASAGNRKTWTYSAWVKLGQTGINTSNDPGNGLFLSTGAGSTAANMTLRITNNGYIGIDYYGIGGFYSSDRLRDPTAWYHCVWVMDTTESTAANRMKVYVNGDLFYNNSMSLSQNADTPINNNVVTRIGVYSYDTSHVYRLDAYLAEVNFIDGFAYDPSYFATTNAITGQWNPKKYTGSYGTNGFYLNFSDNSGTTATTLGKDSSGNGHNFTPSNFNVTANSVENDSVLDTPTNNWCTLNPLTGGWTEGGTIPLADGMLHADNPNSGDKSVHATFTLKAGKKYYIEGVYLEPSGGGSQCKWALSTLDRNNGMPKKPASTGSFGIDWRGGAGTTQSIDESSQDNIGSRPASGTVIGVAIDLVNGKFYAHQGNTYYNSGNPDNGTGAIVTGIPTGVDYFFTTSVDSGGPNFSEFKINFGQQGFQYQPSSFTDLLNSQSLDDPSILLPSDYFNTLLYTGNDSSSRDITGVGFQPDWLWIKNRDQTDWHQIIDAVRGANKTLFANEEDGENTDNSNGHVNSFLTDGFNVDAGSGGNVNENNEDYVAWNWNAGGSTVTNNDGSVTSTIRASSTSGFSICTWTGTGSNLTVGHGLGVTPKAYIVKARTGSSGCDWFVYHKEYGATKNLRWNHTTQATSSSNLFNNTEPTSTVISIGNSSCINENNGTYLAYVFSEVAGYSKFGSYRGNGSAVGSFVFTGFRPAWVMTKIIDTMNENWTVSDNKRSPVNPVNLFLRPDEATQDTSGAATMDFTANGFKLRNTDDKTNRNGAIFIYFAFAESPFKNSRAR